MPDSLPPMTTVLLATDATWIHDQVDAALVDDDTTLLTVEAGRDVLPAVQEHSPDLVVLDLQIGNMGGMATCLSLRLEEGAGRLERSRVLMLLDRTDDVFLARRSDADGWLVKPLDAFRLRRAAEAVLGGDTWQEGVPEDAAAVDPMIPAVEADEPEGSDDPVVADGTPQPAG